MKLTRIKNLLAKLKSMVAQSREILRLQDGSLDLLGLFVSIIVLVTFFLGLTLPPFVYYFELDAVVHFHRIIFSKALYSNMWFCLFIYFVRYLIGTWNIWEGYSFIFTFSIYTFLIVGTYHYKFKRLKQQNASIERIRAYRALAILFVPINNSLKILISSFLGICYWIMQITNTIVILGLNVIPWQFYVSIPFASVYNFIIIVVLWRIVTSMDEESKAVKRNWQKSLVGVPRGANCRLEKICLRKSVASMRPISVTYGSFGRMRLCTMRGYLYSLLTDTVQLCVVLKPR